MNRSELLFRNGCRKWHTYLERCAKDGRFDETSQLLERIRQYLENWKESLSVACVKTREAQKQVIECHQKEASIHLRMRMLGQLLAAMGRKTAGESVKAKRPINETTGQLGGNNE